jgi:hypothetical protein
LSSTNDAVVLDGSLSKDEDGSIIAFNWKQLSGPTINIVSPSLVQTVVTGLQPAVYEFELTVTDNNGATGSDNVTITVAPPPNSPPSANAGADQSVNISQTNNTITLNGSNSTDPEGKPLTFKWKLAGGPNTPNIVDPGIATTTVTGLVPGEYEFELTVTDDQGAADTASTKVNAFIKETPQQKTCGPLKGVVDMFGKLEGSINADLFKEFKEAFGLYGQAEEYFKVLQDIQNEDADKHLDFFASPFNNNDTVELIFEWLTRLQKIIVERKELRGLALRFYRVVIRLAMYIVCIQKEDIEVAKVPMVKVFAIIQRHVRQWIDLISTGAFATADTATVKSIGGDIEKEMVRVKDNGEDTIKVKYLSVLNSILKMINSIP